MISSKLGMYDHLLARCYYFLARVYEAKGNISLGFDRFASDLKTSALRHDVETNATLFNNLLRMFCLAGQFDLASKLFEKSIFPESASGANHARYHYYVGTSNPSIKKIDPSVLTVFSQLASCKGRIHRSQGELATGTEKGTSRESRPRLYSSD